MIYLQVVRSYRGTTMKSRSGFTLFEIVLTLLIVVFILAYMIPVLGLSIFRYDRSITELQEMINIKMVVENITHDYVNRCFEEPGFDLLKLSKRIGQTNTYVTRVGSLDTYYPYGYDGQKYISYFVKCNEFVYENESGKKINLIRSSSQNDKMLLVTIQSSRSSNSSLTVLFTEK
jgi:competence protein ComGC